MSVPHFTSFCCCMGLESGSVFIGVIHLVVSFGLTVASSVYADRFRALAGTAEDAGDGIYSTWLAISAALAVLSAGHALIAATLLYAVYTRSPRALRVWVWLMCTLLAASLLYVAGSMTFGFSASGSEIFLAFLEGLLFFGLVAYCILCVNSYYLLLKSAEDMRGPTKVDC